MKKTNSSSRRALALCCAISPLLANSSLTAATVAQWDFEGGGTAGTPFSTTPAVDISGNGNTMYGFSAFYGPSYSSTTADGSLFSSRHDANHQDGYTQGGAVNTWSPLTWTIEVSVKLDTLAGWNTIIGRDGSISGPASDFYLQNNGINDRFRVDFNTVGNTRCVIDSDFIPTVGLWYGLAVVSDGNTVTMYADKLDGNGYQSVGSAAIGGSNHALAQTGANWTFGRGWYNGGFGDNITGNLDNIRFSDTALSPVQFLAVPEPGSLALVSLAGGMGLLFWRRRAVK
jgi:hypothetical protein